MKSGEARGRSAFMMLLVLLMTAMQSSLAASMLDFDIWMRKIDKKIVDVQKRISQKEDEAAIQSAEEIEDLYLKMENYFIQIKHPEEAVQMSRDGKDAAAIISASVRNQNYDKGAQAAVSIAKACSACHDSYRPFK
jgi:cytochrome c553